MKNKIKARRTITGKVYRVRIIETKKRDGKSVRRERTVCLLKKIPSFKQLAKISSNFGDASCFVYYRNRPIKILFKSKDGVIL